MGKQSRLRRERREARALDRRFDGAPVVGEPMRILRSLHREIQGACGESGRRCWEYLLEIMAISSGWNTESDESKHLWDGKIPQDSRWMEFLQSWVHEVKHAKANGLAFSEPFGDLLQEVAGTNDAQGQFFTPMALVRATNAMTLQGLDDEARHSDGFPTHRGLDPCCGTGRFMIDALVHNDNLMMHGVDVDLWMVRAAMLNVRLLAPWTSLRLTDPNDRLKPLRRARRALEAALADNPFDRTDVDVDDLEQLVQLPYRKDENKDRVLVIGGRAIFIHGDALVVDLDYGPNWLCAGWAWKPHPWQWNLKMAGYHGSYDQWVAAGRPTAEQVEQQLRNEVQFDYSMAKKDPHGGKGAVTHEGRRSL